MIGSSDEVFRRHFVAIATETYEAMPPLPGVSDEVAALKSWLTAESLQDRRFVAEYPELAHDPTLNQIRERFENPPADAAWSMEDAAIVFVTGHGIVREGAHWVVLRGTNFNRLTGTTLRTADLVAWLLDANPAHLLLILDLCYAGQTAADISTFSRDLPRAWLMLASTTKGEEAMTGTLTAAIQEFLLVLKSPQGQKFGKGPYVQVKDFIEEVQSRLGDAQQLALLSVPIPELGESVLLPNPWYAPANALGVEARRSDLSLRPEDVASHWGPRARGVSVESDAKWLFTGRGDLMRELIRVASGPPGTTLITGCAGSGKSSVLARLVTLSDRSFLRAHEEEVVQIPADLRPRVDAVHSAVLATGKYPKEVLIQLLESAGLDDPSGSGQGMERYLEAWEDWLDSLTQPVTVVIDAIDESEDPQALIALLQRLSTDRTRKKLRLLVGVRSPGGPGEDDGASLNPEVLALADIAEELLRANRIRVDDRPWWNQQDIADYATSILLTTEKSPYASTNPRFARSISRALASSTGRSFLVARIAASSLADRPAVLDSSDPHWLDAVREGVIGVFSNDLAHVVPTLADRLRAIHLLRAVAFARGRGMPWRKIWPRVATAVAGDPDVLYGDGDIAWLMQSRLGAYLVEDTEDGVTVYRLFHDILRSTLRDDWKRLLGAAREPRGGDEDVVEIRAIEGRIARALTELTRINVIGGLRIPPAAYVRRHFADHAQAGAVLEARMLAAEFLPYLDLFRFRSVTARDDVPHSLKPLTEALRKVTYLWDWDHPTSNASALELRLALSNVPRQARETGEPWSVRWAESAERSEVLYSGSYEAYGLLEVATLPDGRTVAVTAVGSRLRVWDADSGSPLGSSSMLHSDPFKAGKIIALDIGSSSQQHTAAFALHTNGLITEWELASGTLSNSVKADKRVFHDSVTPHDALFAVGLTVDGGLLAAVGSPSWSHYSAENSPLHVYDMKTGLVSWSQASRAKSLASVQLCDGRLGLITGHLDGSITVWDFTDGRVLYNCETSGVPVNHLEAIKISDREDAIVWKDDSGTVRLARLDGRASGVGRLARLHHRERWFTGNIIAHQVIAMSTKLLPDGRILIVMREAEGVYRVWDPVRGVQVGRETVVQGFAPSNSEPGNGLVVTDQGRARWTTSLASSADGRLMVVGSKEDTVHVWDAYTGAAIGAPRTGHTRPILTLRTSTLHNGRVAAFTEAADSSVRVWEIGDLTTEATGSISAASPVLAVDVLTLQDSQAVVVAAQARIGSFVLRTLDFSEGRPVAPAITAGTGSLSAAAFVGLPDGRLIGLVGDRSSSLRAVNLLTGDTHEMRSGSRRQAPITAVAAGVFFGRAIAVTATSGGSLEVWDPSSGQPLEGHGHGHDDHISALRLLQLSDAQVIVVSASRDHTVGVWDTESLEPFGLMLRGHTAPITALDVALASSGPVAVTGQLDGTVRLWDLDTRKPLSPPLRAHADSVTAVAITTLTDGTEVALSAGVDGRLLLWSLETQQQVCDPLIGAGKIFAMSAASGLMPTAVLGGESLAAVELFPR